MSKKKSRRAAERAAELAEEAEETGEAIYGAVEDGLDEAHRYLKRQWDERPVAVAATALGIGLVLGLMLGSRR
jgi:ElaB/YqjD/DUF883 family membrane-anchored ribosome-binding protein